MSKPRKTTPPKINLEFWLLLAGLATAALFAGVFLFFVAALAPKPPAHIGAMPPAAPPRPPAPGWTPPPTWTPGPTPVVISTALPTAVNDGSLPTRVYTPQPTSVPLAQLPIPFMAPQKSIDVLDLARILEGESRFDLEAAYFVGWVAKNRLLHPNYGDTFASVSSGFFGYREDRQPRDEFIALARRIIREPATMDPTGGCLFALSRTDITKLGVPPGRADLNVNEWFFFRTWPISRRA